MATRAQIRTRGRIRADQDAGAFPDGTQSDFLIDEAGQEVWYDLWGAGMPIAFTTTNITANGASSYVLNGGAAVMGIRRAYLNVGGELFPLRRLDTSDEGALRSLGGQSGLPGFYEVRLSPTQGPVIEFLPTPASGSYRVDHVPEWPGFSSDSDVWRGPARSDELIVLQFASKALRKEGERGDADDLDGEYQRLYDKVVRSASWFDATQTARIRDVERANRTLDSFDYQVVGPGRD